MDNPTWAEVLDEIMDVRVRRVHTAMPGKVLSYDHTTQTADIEPQLRSDGAELQPIPSVPIVWPLAYTDLAAGDTVLLIFCEADIGLWRQQGEAGEPQDVGRHGLHGAVAIAGLARASAAKTFTAGSTVLPGADVRLGAATAAQGVLRATDWGAFMSTDITGFLAVFSAWADLLAAATGVPSATIKTALTAYKTGLTTGGWVSTQVKVP